MPPPWRTFNRMNWQTRARSLLRKRGWPIAELSRRADIDIQALYKQLRSVKQPRGDVLRRIAAALGTSEHWLRTGEGLAISEIPLEGYMSAGEAYVPFDDGSGAFDAVALDFGDTPIAVEVRGTSMLPVYRSGDRLIGDRRTGATEIATCVNRDCIVMTAKGEGYIKRFVKGSRPGVYTLRSHNRDFDDIENVAVLWVAPIMWVRRG